MPAKYVYKEEVSDGPRVKWDLAELVAFVRMWDANASTADMARIFRVTKGNIRRRAALLRACGVYLKKRGGNKGKIDRRRA